MDRADVAKFFSHIFVLDPSNSGTSGHTNQGRKNELQENPINNLLSHFPVAVDIDKALTINININMKLSTFATAATLLYSSSKTTTAFVPSKMHPTRGGTFLSVASQSTTDIDTRTGKPTGTSFLPEETIERAKVGNPIEKAKIAKDATSAFVDIYEYAAKIRAGEMTWEDVEKADLDTVSRHKYRSLHRM
jgi:hypothetical protein